MLAVNLLKGTVFVFLRFIMLAKDKGCLAKLFYDVLWYRTQWELNIEKVSRLCLFIKIYCIKLSAWDRWQNCIALWMITSCMQTLIFFQIYVLFVYEDLLQ